MALLWRSTHAPQINVIYIWSFSISLVHLTLKKGILKQKYLDLYYTHSVKWKWNTITPPCPLGSIGAWNQYHHYLKCNQIFFPISVTCCHLHLQLHDTSLSHTCFLHISAKFIQPSRLIQGSLLSWIGLKLE